MLKVHFGVISGKFASVSASSITPRGLVPPAAPLVAGLAAWQRQVEGASATLICVHGGLDRGGSFARIARRSEHFNVVAYDRRGYQGSRGRQPIDLNGHIDDLCAIATAVQSLGPVIVLGHSYGGVVAIGAALRRPDLFALLVTYEAPLPWIYRRPGFTNDLHEDPSEEAEQFFRRMISSAAWDRLSDDDKASRRADGIALLDDLRTLRGSAPYELATLEIPCVYAYGDGPHQIYYEELVQHLVATSPVFRATSLLAANHGAHLSNPDQLLKLITDEWTHLCALP